MVSIVYIYLPETTIGLLSLGLLRMSGLEAENKGKISSTHELGGHKNTVNHP